MAKPTITIEFLEDVEVLDAFKQVSFSAKAGEVRELVAPSARFWLTRDKAKVVEKKPDLAKHAAPDAEIAPEPKRAAPKKKRVARKKVS